MATSNDSREGSSPFADKKTQCLGWPIQAFFWLEWAAR